MEERILEILLSHFDFRPADRAKEIGSMLREFIEWKDNNVEFWESQPYSGDPLGDFFNYWYDNVKTK